MYGEQDQVAMEALLEGRTDTRTLAALLLKLPISKDQTINLMIRQARVAETAERIAVAQLTGTAPPKDLHQMMQRTVAIAQQVHAQLEKLVMNVG